jgi:helix-turn-helix protein
MFVERNEAGEIVAAYSSAQPGHAEEFLKENHKELAEFYKRLMERSAP